MKTFDWGGFLRHHPILSALDEKHAQWLVSDEVSTERRYGPGAVVFREGDEGDSIFLIGFGSVEAVLSAGGGQTIQLSVMKRGETFGEMAFFEGKPRSATVRVLEACVLLEIKGQELRRLADLRPDIELKVLLTVSERLRSKNENLLALHLAAVESANRAKDEFVAMLGHELRNPLGAISAAVEVLNLLGDSNQKAARSREIIVRQTHHLSRLVEDLLDVSKLISGKFTLYRRSEDLKRIAEQAVASYQEAGKSIRHVISLTGESVRVNVDPTRLEEVVTNLLENALKYTPTGGKIDVSVGSEGREAVLRVRDTGVGIHRDALPLIFDVFVQASQTLDRSEGGLGLGLALVKRLVELHGGTVSASSPGPDQGSEFVVRLPRSFEEAAAPRPGEPRRTSQRARHILIIEDNRDFREGVRMLLEAWGHQVIEAQDGESGLEIFRTSRPEVLLVDIGLPGLDGYSVARAVRSASGGEAPLLVAITGYGRFADRNRAMEAGFDAHMTKPVDPDELTRVLH